MYIYIHSAVPNFGQTGVIVRRGLEGALCCHSRFDKIRIYHRPNTVCVCVYGFTGCVFLSHLHNVYITRVYTVSPSLPSFIFRQVFIFFPSLFSQYLVLPDVSTNRTAVSRSMRFCPN